MMEGNVGDVQGFLPVLGRYHVYSSVNVNVIAQKLGMSRPFSLAQISSQLSAIPSTKTFHAASRNSRGNTSGRFSNAHHQQ
jgi:hypothetical protein